MVKMQRVASLLMRVPAALLDQVQQRVANSNQLALHATFTTAAAMAQLRRVGLCCLAPCGLQAPVLQLSAAQLHSSSSLNDSAQEDTQQTNDASVNDSRGNSAYHVNPISLDQLLGSSPIAANASSGNPASQSQQQQQLTEQMLSQLFDAELEQRLLSAAAVARASTSITAGPSELQDSAAGATGAQQQHDTCPPHQNPTSQQQQQQRMHQPGVVPMQQQQSGADQAGSSSSTATARVGRWTPLDKADPWAPIPWPAFARRRLPGQLQQLLEQAGVPPGTAAAAIAEAATDSPTNTAAAAAAGQADASRSSSSSSSRVPQQPTRPRSYRMQQQQQQRQQQQQSAAHESYIGVFNRLQHKQLVSLLEDCQAPTYGDKQLLLRRLVLLLQEQKAAAALADTPALEPLPQGLGCGVGFWTEGEQGFRPQPHHGTVDAGVDAVNNYDSSGTVTAKSEADKVVNHHHYHHHHHQQQQQQQRGSPLSQQVQAAAAARQQLLAAVLDAGQVGSWLMAARAQDVCIVDVRGRAGLHQQLVVATGLSQRHAHACAEAIAWQLKEKAKDHLAQQQQQQQILAGQQQQQTPAGQQQQGQEFPADQLPSLSVLGDASSDWAVLDAGTVVVHVLTDRARRFYNLEGLWGGPQGRFISWLTPEQVVETKDTIGRDAADGSA